MIEGYVGEAILLELVLADRATGKYPRARVLDASGVQLGGTIPLSPSPATGWAYWGAWTPSSAGQFFVVYDTFDDAGFTVLSIHEPGEDHLLIHDIQQDLGFRKTLGHLGENVRDDVLSYDLNNRPLTFRRRIFATQAAANLSTPGGSGEGEIATVIGSAIHYDAARWETLVRTLTP
jgi:hypothetical protein